MELWSDIDTMPHKVFMRFQRYVMIEQGIGSDVQSFDKLFTKTYEYISHNKMQYAYDEVMNMRNLFFNLVEKEQDPKLSAIAVLVKGNEDKGEDEIDKYVNDVLKHKSVGEIYKTYFDLKKKLLSVV